MDNIGRANNRMDVRFLREAIKAQVDALVKRLFKKICARPKFVENCENSANPKYEHKKVFDKG